MSVLKKDGTMKKSYEKAFKELLRDAKDGRKESTYYLKKWEISTTRKKLHDEDFYKMTDLLYFMNIPFELGNSGRGGAESDFIKVKFDGRLAGVKMLKERINE